MQNNSARPTFRFALCCALATFLFLTGTKFLIWGLRMLPGDLGGKKLLPTNPTMPPRPTLSPEELPNVTRVH